MCFIADLPGHEDSGDNQQLDWTDAAAAVGTFKLLMTSRLLLWRSACFDLRIDDDYGCASNGRGHVVRELAGW